MFLVSAVVAAFELKVPVACAVAVHLPGSAAVDLWALVECRGRKVGSGVGFHWSFPPKYVQKIPPCVQMSLKFSSILACLAGSLFFLYLWSSLSAPIPICTMHCQVRKSTTPLANSPSLKSTAHF